MTFTPGHVSSRSLVSHVAAYPLYKRSYNGMKLQRLAAATIHESAIEPKREDQTLLLQSCKVLKSTNLSMLLAHLPPRECCIGNYLGVLPTFFQNSFNAYTENDFHHISCWQRPSFLIKDFFKIFQFPTQF